LRQNPFEDYYFRYLDGKYKLVSHVDDLTKFYGYDRDAEYVEYDKIDAEIVLGQRPKDFLETFPKDIINLDDNEILFK